MAFNVLKDPQDPRNFIITPAPPGGADPLLLEAGQQAATVGLPGNRPAVRQLGEKQAKEEAGRFGGPGDPRQFRRGLINLQGSLLKKTFDSNKRALIEDFTRAGGIVTEEVAGQVDNALRSTGGFAAARDVMADFRDMQPDRVAQRQADLTALEEKAARQVTSEENANQIQEDQIQEFARTLGQSSEAVVKARSKVNTFYNLQDDLVDVGTLFEKHGPIRINDLLDSDKVAVKQAYNDMRVNNIGAYRQEFELGVLQKSDMEFLNEEVWIPTDTFANLHPSARRVWLQNAQIRAKRVIEKTIDSNIALRDGSRPMQWRPGEGKPYLQIIAVQQPIGTSQASAAQVSNFLQTQERRGEIAAGTTPTPVELGGPDLTGLPAPPQDFSPSSEVSPGAPAIGILPSATTGQRTGGPETPAEIAVMGGAESFFEGINELVGEFARAEGVFALPEEEEEP